MELWRNAGLGERAGALADAVRTHAALRFLGLQNCRVEGEDAVLLAEAAASRIPGELVVDLRGKSLWEGGPGVPPPGELT